jgi:guanylate kinase
MKHDRPDEGVLFIVSGPSGVGKSTLVRAALDRVPGLVFSVSATTRPPREGERDGVDYRFVSPEQFERWVQEDAFLEHATVYGRRYGTLRTATQQVLGDGISVLLDIDVQGAAQVRARRPDAVSVFILPPALASLADRLRSRGTDERTVQTRMSQSGEQLIRCAEYDYVVVNAELDAACDAFCSILLAETFRRERRMRAVRQMLSEL